MAAAQLTCDLRLTDNPGFLKRIGPNCAKSPPPIDLLLLDLYILFVFK